MPDAKTYDNFEEIFSEENFNALKNLTVREYKSIIENIKRDKEKSDNDLSALEKVHRICESFAQISFKSEGKNHGSYSYNTILIDDRLNEADQIATMIHELSHHIFSQILEEIVIKLWNCEKSNVISAFIWFTVIASPLTQLTNEYSAHACEGHFIPEGHQNFDSFNNIIKNDFDLEKDARAIIIGLVMGNTIAKDIISILDEVIESDLKEEILIQFEKDHDDSQKNSPILLETDIIMGDEEKILSLVSILKSGFKAAENRRMQEILEIFKEKFNEV